MARCYYRVVIGDTSRNYNEVKRICSDQCNRLPPVKMKSTRINIYSRLDDELYMSEELEELLYQRWFLKVKKQEEQKTRELWARWRMYFCGGMCLAHDRDRCPQCLSYARGECPSLREENYLPHDF
jgi:hypothetical protein